MMATVEDGVSTGNLLNNRRNKLGRRKVWPRPGVQDQKEWTRYAYLARILNRPGQSRPLNFLHPEWSAVFQEPIDYNDRQSFHCAIGWILAVGQCFGILPLAGVRAESPGKLVFKISSLRTAYAIAVMVTLFAMAVTKICHVIQTVEVRGTHDDITAAFSGSSFFIASVLRAVIFMWLAPRWASLQRDWRAIERFLDRFEVWVKLYYGSYLWYWCCIGLGLSFTVWIISAGNERQSIRLRSKFSILTVAIMLIALLEHGLFFVQLIPQEFGVLVSNRNFGDVLKCICEKAYPFIFTICNYNLGIGIFIIFISTVEISTLYFMDVFVMLVSMGLAERYKTFNQRLVDTIPTSNRNSDWHKLRESYAALSTLVKKVDKNISPLILLSIASNTVFICLQLRNGLSPHENNALKTIFLCYCSASLIGKTVTVMLLAAQINDQSRIALPKLFNCPGPAYSIEAQRLQQQLSTDEVCLTGMGFFSVTRNSILAVAGTIVTYEVLLLNSTPQ